MKSTVSFFHFYPHISFEAFSFVVTDVTLLAGNFKNRQIDWQRVVWSPIAAILLNTFLMCDTSLKKDEKSLSFYKSVFSEFWDYGL